MKVSFQTKEESNKMQLESFLKLSKAPAGFFALYALMASSEDSPK